MAQGDAMSFPDGVGDPHTRLRGSSRHASLLSLIILATILAAALLGLFGGGKATVRIIETPAARLTVATPNVMRSGVFFETRIRVIARHDIAKPTLAISSTLWRDMTINSTIPQADKESFERGAFRMEYPALRAGDALDVKIYGQINPPLTLGTNGAIELYDGDGPIAPQQLSLTVLP